MTLFSGYIFRLLSKEVSYTLPFYAKIYVNQQIEIYILYDMLDCFVTIMNELEMPQSWISQSPWIEHH